ncbi:MAG: hypothetical protein RLZZ624_758 [Cyanobacteriota bacterium]|jgi:hypothetical protein
MNPTLSVAAGSALLLALWLLGRPRPRLSSRQDTAAIAALNREQIVRLIDPEDQAPAVSSEETALPLPPLPQQPAERVRFLAQLERWSRGGSQERLLAMQACAHWGQRAALPLLRRGRHDPDPAVALVAAQALERFRGRVAAPALAVQPLPRRVSRTR